MGSFVCSRPGFGLKELGLIRPAIIHRDLVGVESPLIGRRMSCLTVHDDLLHAAVLGVS
jgi:hypothetical protein